MKEAFGVYEGKSLQPMTREELIAAFDLRARRNFPGFWLRWRCGGNSHPLGQMVLLGAWVVVGSPGQCQGLCLCGQMMKNSRCLHRGEPRVPCNDKVIVNFSVRGGTGEVIGFSSAITIVGTFEKARSLALYPR